jgi:FixJ family two-component response regulator
MPGMDGLTLQERMSVNGLHAPIVFVSGHGDVSSSVRAMKHGAIDFIEKPFDDQDLLNAVGRAIDMDRELRRLRSDKSQVRVTLLRLTSREFEVMTHVIAGKPNKVIALELGVSEKTVKVHRGRVMKKMEAGSLADLVRMTEKAGIGAAKRRDALGGVDSLDGV